MLIKEVIFSQVTSGRWLLTVSAAIALLMLVVADLFAIHAGRPLPISTEAIFSIITMVFVNYFNKPTEKDNSNNGNGDNGKQNPPVK